MRILACLFALGSLTFTHVAFSETLEDYLVAPYTLRTDDGDILLKFHLNKSKLLKINYALPGESIDKEEVDFEEFSHESVNSISFGNQGCGEKIRFRITDKNSSNESIKGIVPSFPCPNSFLEEDVVFGFITDTQMNVMGRLSKLSKMISEKNIQDYSFIVNAGDVIQKGGNHDHWVEFFEASRPFLEKTPFISAVGNHAYYQDDSITEVPKYFQQYLRWDGATDFGGVSIDFNKFQLIVYNSTTHKLSLLASRQQLKWLESELIKAEKKNIPAIFVAHYPPFSSTGFNKGDKAQDMRDRVVPLLEKHRVKLVLSGHTHIYERSFKNGIHYVTGGPAGGLHPLFKVKNNPYSVLTNRRESTFSRVKVGFKRIEFITWNSQGKEIDKFEIPL